MACRDPNLHFVEQVALRPPEVVVDLQQQQAYEAELSKAMAVPLPVRPAVWTPCLLHAQGRVAPTISLRRRWQHRGAVAVLRNSTANSQLSAAVLSLSSRLRVVCREPLGTQSYCG